MRFHNKLKYIKIRGHHLLCMQFFQEYGYNSSFIDNMQKVIEKINKNPNCLIELTTKCDVICKQCPWNKNQRCTNTYGSSNDIKMRDKKILNYFKLNTNSKIKAEKLMKIIKNKLPEVNLKELCGNCQWFELCIQIYNGIHTR